MSTDDYRRQRSGAFEWGREHAHRQSPIRQRTAQSVDDGVRLLRGPLRDARGTRCIGSQVPLACADGHRGPFDADGDLVKLAVAMLGRRVVSEQLIRTVVGNNILEAVAKIVGVDQRHAAGVFGDHPQRTLPVDLSLSGYTSRDTSTGTSAAPRAQTGRVNRIDRDVVSLSCTDSIAVARKNVRGSFPHR